MYSFLPTVTVRLSAKEKEDLLTYSNNISQALKEGLRLYIRERKKQRALRKLAELQERNPLKISSAEIAKMIREDRRR